MGESFWPDICPDVRRISCPKISLGAACPFLRKRFQLPSQNQLDILWFNLHMYTPYMSVCMGVLSLLQNSEGLGKSMTLGARKLTSQNRSYHRRKHSVAEIAQGFFPLPAPKKVIARFLKTASKSRKAHSDQGSVAAATRCRPCDHGTLRENYSGSG